MRLLMCALFSSAALATAIVLQAQSPAAQSAVVVGVGNFLHVVADVERAITFYRDVLGMESAAPATPGPRPFLTTPEVVQLYNATGGRYRTANAGVTGSPMRVELVEWADVDRLPVAPRYSEPGAGTLVLTVRDLDATLARVKANGAAVVTSGGSPVSILDERGQARAVIVRDPDGFYVQLTQRDAASAAATAPGNAIDIGFSVTVADLGQARAVFGDTLGFDMKVDSAEKDANRLALMGLAGASYRRASALVPGTSLRGEFVEVRGVERRALTSRPQDPGSAMLRLMVSDVEQAKAKLAAVKVTAVSTGGQPVTMTNPNATQRYLMVRLPDNLFMQLVQRLSPPLR